MKKFTSMVLCSFIITGLLPLNVSAITTDFTASTTVEEDGTIHTKEVYSDGDELSYYYTPAREGVYARYDYADAYILNVTAKDSAAFEAEFDAELSDIYTKLLLDDGSYAVWRNDSQVTDDSAYTVCSQLTYEAVKEMLPNVLALDSVETAAIQKGYRIINWSLFEMGYDFNVYSSKELTDSDFAWASDMGYKFKITENEERGYYNVYINYSGSMEYWEYRYEFMRNCMDMPSVDAVTISYIEKTLFVNLDYETVEVYKNDTEYDCDVNQNGTVDITDATLVLEYYASSAAGILQTSGEDKMDVNGDGAVDIADATYILTYYAEAAAGLR